MGKYTTIDRLLKAIGNQKTALFIGAGAPRCELMHDHQLPDGRVIKLELYIYSYGRNNVLDHSIEYENYEEEFRKDFNIIDEYIPPELVWEKCLVKHGKDLTKYLKLLEKMLDKEIYTPPNYKFMAWLHLMDENPINQVVTTNFDEKIEDAYRLLQQRGLFTDITVLTAVDDADFSNFSENTMKKTAVIHKLHGTISKPFTIKASATDMSKGLSPEKYNVLKDVLTNNDLVVFVGYACNDDDVFKALEAISKEKGHKAEIAWIKRKPKTVKKESNICKVLAAFGSTGNIIESESYNFFKEFFDTYVDREKISMSLIEQHKNFMTNVVIKDTKDLVYDGEKEPIPDVLYGEIKFPKDSRKDVFRILNSFDMQRLRDIKQLPFAQYRYPSATHTRFSHSLGVAYLVSEALGNQNFEQVSADDKKNTIYAALLHDVGHGPLGHVIDKFYDRLQKGNEHEEFTKRFINEGLIDLREVLDAVQINRTEVGDRIVFKSRNNEELKKYANKVHLNWLITDYALDLDRIDFLMRDLLMTSYKCQSKTPTEIRGTQRKRRWKDVLNDISMDFVSRLCIGTVKELDKSSIGKFMEDGNIIEDIKILYLDDDKTDYKFKLDELLTFLLEIYTEMYLKVYYHDRISCADAMVAKALHIAYDAGDIDRSSLYKFTDSELYAYLENLENDLIREIVYSVKHRRLFRPVVQFDIDMPENISAVILEEKIAEEFKLDQNTFQSIVVAHIPRKKELENLFIKREDKIIAYPDIRQFEEKLSNIKGTIFVHSKNKVYSNEADKQKLVDLLNGMGITAEVIPKVTAREHPKPQTTFDMWRENNS